MRRGWRVLPLVAAAAAGLSRLAHAQATLRFTAEAAAAAVRVRSDMGSAVESLSGPAVALEVGARHGPVLLAACYGEGHLTSTDASIPARDLVEGSLLLGVRIGPFVTLLAGPHARAYHTSSGTSRWVFWEARARGTAPLLAPRLEAYAELGATVLGSSNLVTSFDAEKSGEVGARYHLARAPLTLRLAYRIERGSGTLPTRSDTVERVLVGVRVGGGP